MAKCPTFLPLPAGERAGVRGQSCLRNKSKRRIIEVWGQPWPLTSILSSLLRAEHIHVLSPRAPKGRGGEGVRCAHYVTPLRRESCRSSPAIHADRSYARKCPPNPR